MIETTSIYEDFHCRISNGSVTCDGDAPISKGGLGIGLRPHEFLEAALASCINITIRMIAKEKGITMGNVFKTPAIYILFNIDHKYFFKILT